jgi:hypothetical protein
MVEFTKVDGTVRKMLCTLAETLIPEEARPKVSVEENVIETEDNPAPPAPTACKVYDLEKQAWRSFRWDSIINYKVWS